MADQEPSKAAQALASQIERDGGRVLAVYQEPVGDHWQIFGLLPRAKCEASPYQRDLSPTHVKRLTESIKRLDRFVDPIVAISPRPGVYWTPNGNHRRAVLDKLKADFIPVILVVEPEMLFEVLPLNVEKAHNLKEKSLEVIRMYRALVTDDPDTTEEKWAAQFEAPHFITLGLLYEENKRFAGGAFAPILRRVDKFLKQTLPKGLDSRTERADMVRAADAALGVAVAKIKKRGINHPYVKNYLLARTTPLTRARKTLPSFEQTFKKLRENLEEFDVSKVRYDEIQRSAIMSSALNDRNDREPSRADERTSETIGRAELRRACLRPPSVQGGLTVPATTEPARTCLRPPSVQAGLTVPATMTASPGASPSSPAGPGRWDRRSPCGSSPTARSSPCRTPSKRSVSG